MTWLIIAILVLSTGLIVLSYRRRVERARPDLWMIEHAARLSTKPVNGTYDEQKAVAGYKRSQQRTETGRLLPKPKTARKMKDNVVRIGQAK